LSDDLLDAYDFDLPESLIAQEPAAERASSRLLAWPREGAHGRDLAFADLPKLLRPGDLLVVNEVRVRAAKIALRRRSGWFVGGLLLTAPVSGSVDALLEGRGRLKVGDELLAPDGGTVRLAADLGGGKWSLAAGAATLAALEALGRMPLPPYIRRGKQDDPRDDVDRERYQTVFAAERAPATAIAAPTAGLHFDPPLLAAIAAMGVERVEVTLAVGLGTFLPVRVTNLRDHTMHQERAIVPPTAAAAIRAARRRGGRVVAVGTTVVRTLESWALAGEPDALDAPTDLFIRPPFRFAVVDALITNFHLPRSTLLVLVAAFAGRERILAAYRHAVASGYRFFSYGDAMFIGGEADEEVR
jgi:S-adenosylmethionine:tRNA ribosyltransferase-isomerase